jgi:hypothetical protein
MSTPIGILHVWHLLLISSLIDRKAVERHNPFMQVFFFSFSGNYHGHLGSRG